MPRSLRVDLVDGCYHFAGSFSAKPDMMAARGPETRSMEEASSRDDQLHRPPGLARRDGRQHRLHLQRVLLAETATKKRRDHLHLLRRDTKRRRDAVTNGLGVLRAFVHGELIASPFGYRGDQLDRVLVLRRAIEHCIDLDRCVCEGLFRVARGDLRDEVLERRVCLIDGLNARSRQGVTSNGSSA